MISEILSGMGKHMNPDFKKGMKFLGKGITKVEGEKTAVYQHILPYKLNGKVSAGIVGAVAAYEVVGGAIDSRHAAELGNSIRATSLSGMTDSVQLSPLIQKLQNGENVGMSNSIRNAGVDGDIVFALHNMR